MNIFDIFRSGPNPNAIQQQATKQDPLNPQNPANPQNVQQTQQTQQNPQQTQEPKVEDKPPVVDYKDLWNIDPKQTGPADPAAFNFKMDEAKINQTFGNLDFTKAVTPELLAKINAGGQDATSAFLTAMNVIAQQAVKTAVVASSKITESGIQTTGQRMKDFVPSLVREHAVSSALREDNPLMKNPAYAPLVEAATLQFARQFPQATPAEIKEHVGKYFDNMTSDIAKHSGNQIVAQPKQPTSSSVQTDWSSEPV